MMNGYIRNQQATWAHALKRNVEPGGEIPLDELYEDYGKKHKLNEGEEFIGWLKSIKLKDPNKWKVIYIPEEKTIEEENISQDENISLDVSTEEVLDEVLDKVEEAVEVSDVNIKDLEVSDIVSLSVRRAREVIPKIMDLNLLRYSVQEAGQLSGKDSLCRILRTRIRNLEINYLPKKTSK